MFLIRIYEHCLRGQEASFTSRVRFKLDLCIFGVLGSPLLLGRIEASLHIILSHRGRGQATIAFYVVLVASTAILKNE